MAEAFLSSEVIAKSLIDRPFVFSFAALQSEKVAVFAIAYKKFSIESSAGLLKGYVARGNEDRVRQVANVITGHIKSNKLLSDTEKRNELKGLRLSLDALPEEMKGASETAIRLLRCEIDALEPSPTP